MRRALRTLLYAMPVLLLALVVAWFALALRPGRDPTAVPSALIDRPAPPVELASIYEAAPGLSAADLRGQVAIVNVFASWCLPCRAEHPVLTRLAREPGIVLYGLNWKDKPEDARAWLEELGDPYRKIGSDPSGRAGIEWGVYGVPETYVVDAEGRIRYKHVGPLSAEDVRAVILPVVRRLGP